MALLPIREWGCPTAASREDSCLVVHEEDSRWLMFVSK